MRLSNNPIQTNSHGFPHQNSYLEDILIFRHTKIQWFSSNLPPNGNFEETNCLSLSQAYKVYSLPLAAANYSTKDAYKKMQSSPI